MQRKIQWRRATREKNGDFVRLSKCGRFRVTTRTMASANNGCWNARHYIPEQLEDGKWVRLHKGNQGAYDVLAHALDHVETVVDPNWTADE